MFWTSLEYCIPTEPWVLGKPGTCSFFACPTLSLLHSSKIWKDKVRMTEAKAFLFLPSWYIIFSFEIMRSNKRRYLIELGWGWGKGLVEDREEFYPLKIKQWCSAVKRWLVQTFKISFLDGSLATLNQNIIAFNVHCTTFTHTSNS